MNVNTRLGSIYPRVLIKRITKNVFKYLEVKNGGGGIRTHGTLADTLVFKTRALNHSTTPPGKNY